MDGDLDDPENKSSEVHILRKKITTKRGNWELKDSIMEKFAKRTQQQPLGNQPSKLKKGFGFLD